MYDAIFLTTPSSLFADVNEAKKCARALLAVVKYFCDKKNITNTDVEVGVSNVNPRKAQYINQSSGVGRPKKILAGNLNNCFVKPHLHILISGKHKSFVSNLIINYFTQRYKSVKNKNKKVRIWKRYVLITDTGRVRKYIWIQSLHYLTFKATRSENNKEAKKKVIKVRVKRPSCTQKNTVLQDNYNQNQILLYNLRSQWLLIENLKNIAYYIVNYELFDKLVILQNKIKKYGDMINANINVASLYYTDVTNITIELENLRQYTNTEKQRYDYFVGQA